MINIEPVSPATHTIVWLHGLGANGQDFEPLAREMNQRGLHSVRHLLPDAPVRPVSINLGMPMRAWYDISDRNLENSPDLNGIAKSCQIIMQLVHNEAGKGIASDHLIIIGFSQGAVIALATLMHHGHTRLGGIAALSGYQPGDSGQKPQPPAPDTLATPVFLAHGTEDDIVPYRHGHSSWQHLSQLGFSTQFKSYRCGHSVCAEEIEDLYQWLTRLTSPSI
jgi:phospholipase/carboxylesterase